MSCWGTTTRRKACPNGHGCDRTDILLHHQPVARQMEFERGGEPCGSSRRHTRQIPGGVSNGRATSGPCEIAVAREDPSASADVPSPCQKVQPPIVYFSGNTTGPSSGPIDRRRDPVAVRRCAATHGGRHMARRGSPGEVMRIRSSVETRHTARRDGTRDSMKGLKGRVAVVTGAARGRLTPHHGSSMRHFATVRPHPQVHASGSDAATARRACLGEPSQVDHRAAVSRPGANFTRVDETGHGGYPRGKPVGSRRVRCPMKSSRILRGVVTGLVASLRR